MTDLSDWTALVLTAGLATRLRPLSTVRAKAAMPVAGEPLVARILGWLRRAGVRRVVLNLHHRPETITRLVGDGAQWDVDVRYSWEPNVLGSAGGPSRALPLLDAERFLIVNGDTLTDCNLRGVVDRHLRSGALVTMAVVPGDVDRYGGVCMDGDHYVHGFGKCGPEMRALHFIGVQVVEAAAFSAVPDDQPSETVRTVYPRLIANRARAISAFASEAEFLDVGTAADYLDTVRIVAAREGRPLDIGIDSRIAPSATVTDCVIWDRVTVLPNAHLSHCVVADDVVVPEGSRYQRSVLTMADGTLSVTAF
jgi:NDP-sugar pyrophosphorylase family protein